MFPLYIVVAKQSRPKKGMMPMLPERICPECGKPFAPETISSKYCPTCAPLVAYRKQQERKRRAYAKRKEEQAAARKQRQLDHKGE